MRTISREKLMAAIEAAKEEMAAVCAAEYNGTTTALSYRCLAVTETEAEFRLTGWNCGFRGYDEQPGPYVWAYIENENKPVVIDEEDGIPTGLDGFWAAVSDC